MWEARDMRFGQQLWLGTCRAADNFLLASSSLNRLPAAAEMPARPCMALLTYRQDLSIRACLLDVTSSRQAIRGRCPVYNHSNPLEDLKCSQESTATLALCHTIKLPRFVASRPVAEWAARLTPTGLLPCMSGSSLQRCLGCAGCRAGHQEGALHNASAPLPTRG